MDTKWQKVSEILKNGGVVIIPSESVFGIAALISNEEAIKKLYQIKKRADNKPSLIIVGSMDQAQELVDFSSKAKELTEKFWPALIATQSVAGGPGGLTMVLDSKNKDLPSLIYGENESLAIRLPNNENLRNLAIEAGPFILPSANFNGEKPPFKKSEIDSELISLVDYVLDEPAGGSEVSTLVDVRDNQLLVLRSGSVKID
jgi:L-threonylcarbamoyladenylate synthase